MINVASVIGKIPAPFHASYAAARFGIVGLCDTLRQEPREEQVESNRVCTVMRMAHDTEFFEHAANYAVHQGVPIPPTYDPQVRIDTLVRLVVEPEDEVNFGWQGVIANVLLHLMPGAVEKFMASNTEKAQFKEAPPAPETSGAVHRPSGS